MKENVNKSYIVKWYKQMHFRMFLRKYSIFC